MVRKSFQLVIAAEIDHFEKKPLAKKTQLIQSKSSIKKNKNIFRICTLFGEKGDTAKNGKQKRFIYVSSDHLQDDLFILCRGV